MLRKLMVAVVAGAVVVISGCSGSALRDIRTVEIVPKINGYSIDSPGAWASALSDGYRRSYGQYTGVDFRYPLGLTPAQRTERVSRDFCLRNTGGGCVFSAADSGWGGGSLLALLAIGGVAWFIYEQLDDCPLDDDEWRTSLGYGEYSRLKREGCKCEDLSRTPGYAGYACQG